MQLYNMLHGWKCLFSVLNTLHTINKDIQRKDLTTFLSRSGDKDFEK